MLAVKTIEGPDPVKESFGSQGFFRDSFEEQIATSKKGVHPF